MVRLSLTVSKGDVWDQSPHHFAQEAFAPVSNDRCANRLACRDSHTHVGLIAFLRNQHNKRVGIGLAITPHPLEVFGSGQTELSLHPRL